MNTFKDRTTVSYAELSTNLEEEAKQLLEEELPSILFDELWRQHTKDQAGIVKFKRTYSPFAKWSFGMVIAVLLTVGSLMGSGFAFPSIAAALSKIPFFDYLYTKGVYSDGIKQIEDKNLTALSDLSVTDQGIEFRVVEVFYDGIQVVLNYEVNYPATSPNITEKDAAVYYQLKFVKLQPSWISTHDFTVTGAHSFVGTTRLNFGDTDLPDKVKLKMSVDCIGTTKGNWNVSVPLSKEKSEGLTKTFYPHIEFTNKASQYTINKLVFGPVTTQLVIKNILPYRLFDVVIEDDIGTLLNSQGGDGASLDYMYFNFSPLAKLNPKPKYITLILNEIQKVDEPEQTEDRKPLKRIYPLVLKGDQGGTIKVTNIDFQKNQTVIYYEASKSMSQKTTIKLENSKGEILFSTEQPVRVSMGSFSFKLVFPPIDEQEAAQIISIPFSYDQELQRIRVPLNWGE